MGACYDVTFKVKMKNTAKAFAAIREWIQSQPWAEDACRTSKREGIDPSSQEGLMRIIFHGFTKPSVFRMSTDSQGTITVDNSFDACYTQEIRMYRFFNDLASYFEDGSSLEVWPDDDAWKIAVKDGICTDADMD